LWDHLNIFVVAIIVIFSAAFRTPEVKPEREPSHGEFETVSTSGLPDGLFSNQKSKFGKIL
jgi:hypothetical protein